jgi:hypothetical protein
VTGTVTVTCDDCDCRVSTVTEWALQMCTKCKLFFGSQAQTDDSHIISAAVFEADVGFEIQRACMCRSIAAPNHFYPIAICIQSGFKILCGSVHPTVIQPFFLPS